MAEERESLVIAFAELLVKCSQQRGSKDRPERALEFAPLLEQLVTERDKLFEGRTASVTIFLYFFHETNTASFYFVHQSYRLD